MMGSDPPKATDYAAVLNNISLALDRHVALGSGLLRSRPSQTSSNSPPNTSSDTPAFSSLSTQHPRPNINATHSRIHTLYEDDPTLRHHEEASLRAATALAFEHNTGLGYVSPSRKQQENEALIPSTSTTNASKLATETLRRRLLGKKAFDRAENGIGRAAGAKQNGSKTRRWGSDEESSDDGEELKGRSSLGKAKKRRKVAEQVDTAATSVNHAPAAEENVQSPDGRTMSPVGEVGYGNADEDMQAGASPDKIPEPQQPALSYKQRKRKEQKKKKRKRTEG